MIKVLYIDIETLPHKGYIWQFFKANIAPNQVIELGYTISVAAKWEDEDEVVCWNVYEHGMERMLEETWKLLYEADVVIHYNGKKFDMPTLNKEFIMHDMPPPSPYQEIDLYQVVRRNFRFARNGMDFVCQELGVEGKVHHKGFELWKDCDVALRWDFEEEVPKELDDSWQTMIEYNMHDVIMTVKLYEKLQPWIKNHPNRALWMDTRHGERVCPNCGGTHLTVHGYHRGLTLQYKRYKCHDCGAWPRERYAEKNKRRDVTRY